jgi:signal transduction histidine kinase
MREGIFDPGTSNSGGTGLGLGISRRVARSLGGDVVLADDADETSTAFVLRLPRG